MKLVQQHDFPLENLAHHHVTAAAGRGSRRRAPTHADGGPHLAARRDRCASTKWRDVAMSSSQAAPHAASAPRAPSGGAGPWCGETRSARARPRGRRPDPRGARRRAIFTCGRRRRAARRSQGAQSLRPPGCAAPSRAPRATSARPSFDLASSSVSATLARARRRPAANRVSTAVAEIPILAQRERAVVARASRAEFAIRAVSRRGDLRVEAPRWRGSLASAFRYARARYRVGPRHRRVALRDPRFEARGRVAVTATPSRASRCC